MPLLLLLLMNLTDINPELITQFSQAGRLLYDPGIAKGPNLQLIIVHFLPIWTLLLESTEYVFILRGCFGLTKNVCYCKEIAQLTHDNSNPR